MNEKRGRPAGTAKVHPNRDRLVHFAVEWVILNTGLGVGRGKGDAAKADACIVTAWLLSGGAFHSDYLTKNPAWSNLVEGVKHNAAIFQAQLSGLNDRPLLLDQLKRMNARAVRNAYQRHQATTPWRPSVYDERRWAERQTRILHGEVPQESSIDGN